MSDNTHQTIKSLDGLRALAALSVFFVHYHQIVQFDFSFGPFDLYRLFTNGDHAVSFFFILSGFLLGLPYWKSLQMNKKFPCIRGFYIRRFVRIIPAYFCILTILVFLSGLWQSPEFIPDILLHYLLIFNYFEFSIFSINPAFWTIAVEVQFYFLLPLIFILIRKLSDKKGLWILFIIIAGTYCLHSWLVRSATKIIPWPVQPWLTWIRPYGAVLTHSLLAHLPHFLLGLVSGSLFLKIKKDPILSSQWRKYSEIIFWFCLVSIFFILGTPMEDELSLPYGQYGFPIIPLLLVMILLSAQSAPIPGRLLNSLAFKSLGEISYGFYLIHYPVLQITYNYMARFGWSGNEYWVSFGAISLLGTILLSGVSWVVVENPAKRYAKKLLKVNFQGGS